MVGLRSPSAGSRASLEIGSFPFPVEIEGGCAGGVAVGAALEASAAIGMSRIRFARSA